jgi:hypothetical protein
VAALEKGVAIAMSGVMSMVKVTLYEFTRNMLAQQRGDTFHVDVADARSGRADRLEPPATGIRKDGTGQDRGVGANVHQVAPFDGGVNWPETKYEHITHGPCPGCGRVLNLRVESCWCQVEKAEKREQEIKAEQAFFNRIGKKPVNVIVPCTRVIDAVSGEDITGQPHVNMLFKKPRS